ncbi:unnamed protein product [Spirodela intermedia]|uniref:Uncharacterized protein n=1 Tax=Spirodela intermedia TaxID=51605 RepID=A0A7I8IWP3_SPIIN|nr:unnamed protein product [Spirodela intermedia]CAA6662191.1 unnamed protein product [Spirodela intermedia]
MERWKIQGKQWGSTFFIKHGEPNKVTTLVVYVDDIIITGDDTEEFKCLGIFLSQHKYILDLLQETGKLECKPADTPIDPDLSSGESKDSDQVDKSSYQHLQSTSGYCTFVCGNLVTWRSTKQQVVAQSSAEAKFRDWPKGYVKAYGFEVCWTD